MCLKKLTVLAMTEKGHAVVRLLLSRYPGLVAKVVIGKDPALAGDFSDEIAKVCLDHEVTFCSRSNPEAIGTDYALAVSWRWLVDARNSSLIILHDSLLPRYRGFNPLVTALINGDTQIGVTALYAAAEYDRGDIIAKSSSTIAYPITIKEAIRVVLANYEELAIKIADALLQDHRPAAEPQREADATYSLWRDEQDYLIDWARPAIEIERSINALGSPYRGAAAMLEGRLVRVLAGCACNDVFIENRSSGKVVFTDAGRPVVVCGPGLLRIDALIDDASGVSLLPLARFRVRFCGALAKD